MVIVTPFPPPNVTVDHAWNLQQIARSGDADEKAALGTLETLPKPWEPASCPDELRNQLWLWLDDVVSWINTQYLWRSTDLIPECWPDHPHIANELAVIACKRLLAAATHTPEPLEEWQRVILPDFLERMALRLGDGGCRAGKHTDWPAAGRHHMAQQPQHVQHRRTAFYRDTHTLVAVDAADAIDHRAGGAR